MNSDAYMGIDLGTSGCRVIAIDDQHNVIASGQSALEFDTSSPTLSEQDPAYQWQVVKQVLLDVIKQCQNFTIKAIAVDATSGSILITDQHGQPISPIVMYNDARAVKESEQIARIAPNQSGAHGATSGLAKLLYLQQHNEFPTDAKLLHQADWINYNLGAPLGISDENNSLKTGYDPVERCWPQWIDVISNISLLPKVVPSGTVIAQLSEQLCQDFNLATAPDIVAGTTDSIAALLATGANNPGDAVTSLGSTLVVKLISDKPLFLPELGIYSHRLVDKWLVGGASNTGGAVLKHYFTKLQLQQLSEQISLNEVAPDFYPLLSVGERFPINDPNMQPKLTPRPESDVVFLHGMLDSMARIEQQSYQCLQQAGATPLTSIRTVGGGAVNQVWQTIRQHYNPVPFITPEHTEAAYGAARLAQGTF
jgi:D-ribulokinase